MAANKFVVQPIILTNHLLRCLISLALCLLISFQTEAQSTTNYGADNKETDTYITNSARRQIEKELFEKGGTIITYTVKRGDSMESIAEKYGITAEVLRLFNPYMDCYVGVELEVPFYGSASEAEESIAASENSALQEGNFYFDRKDYKKAIECYNRTIKNGTAPIQAYYKRGLAWYNREKYRQAIDDMGYVVSNDASNRYPDASDYYSKAKELQAQRDEANSQAWGELFGMVLSTAAVVTTNISANKNKARSSSESTQGYESNDSSDDYDSSDDISTGTSKSTSKKKSKCGTCSGRGYTVEYTAGYGLSDKKYCSECGKTVPITHYHKTCHQCNGTGYR